MEKLHDGLFWQIGIDSQTPIFKANWGGAHRVQLSGNYTDSMLAPITCGDFMIPYFNGWDESKVRQVFNSNDASEILQCTIANRAVDVLIWGNHSSGTYSTRSGYNWLMKEFHDNSTPSKLWFTISKLKVLPKIQIFIWRVAHEALLVYGRIGVLSSPDGLCPLRHSEIETVLHALRDFHLTREILYLFKLPGRAILNSSLSCLLWLEHCEAILSFDMFAEFVVLLWNIWNRRNTLVHDKKLQPSFLIVENAQHIHKEFNGASITPLTYGVPQKHTSTTWTKPPTCMISLTVDGMFHSPTGTGAMGFLARDHNGLVLAGCARTLPRTDSAEMVEAHAFYAAILFALDQGWTSVRVEGHAANVVNQLIARDNGRSILAQSLTEARTILGTNPHITVAYIPQLENEAAHSLAHWAFSENLCNYFYDECPPCIEQFLIHDAING